MNRKPQKRAPTFSLKSKTCDVLMDRYKDLKAKKSRNDDFCMGLETFMGLNWKQIMGIVLVKDRNASKLKQLLSLEAWALMNQNFQCIMMDSYKIVNRTGHNVNSDWAWVALGFHLWEHFRFRQLPVGLHIRHFESESADESRDDYDGLFKADERRGKDRVTF